MPPAKLNNTYFLVRAGESEWESAGRINTNPVAKTSMDSGLSRVGRRQAASAATALASAGACEAAPWIWPSITQRAYQTAEAVAYVCGLSHSAGGGLPPSFPPPLLPAATVSKIVPEYSFLDARGVGAYEGRPLAALDEVHVADARSPSERPPPASDGTTHESVNDVLVRVTQLMSILETQYYGDTVVIVAPDSDNLTVLQAALTGLDLRKHASLAFAPGEVREVDITGTVIPPAVTGIVSFGS
eukprot:SM000415S15585  [mRNA]  locus=s415:89:1664:+ [translate_table: standard]